MRVDTALRAVLMPVAAGAGDWDGPLIRADVALCFVEGLHGTLARHSGRSNRSVDRQRPGEPVIISS